MTTLVKVLLVLGALALIGWLVHDRPEDTVDGSLYTATPGSCIAGESAEGTDARVVDCGDPAARYRMIGVGAPNSGFVAMPGSQGPCAAHPGTSRALTVSLFRSGQQGRYSAFTLCLGPLKPAG